MSTYRTRPQLIEAVQYTGDNAEEVAALWGMGIYDRSPVLILSDKHRFAGTSIQTGQWAVRFADGGADRLTDAQFRERYEPAEPEPAGGEG